MRHEFAAKRTFGFVFDGTAGARLGPVRSVLVPFDSSGRSRELVQFATRLAEHSAGQVNLIDVRPPVAAQVILDAAADVVPDVIVLDGRRGNGSSRGVIPRVVSESPCTVLVYRGRSRGPGIRSILSRVELTADGAGLLQWAAFAARQWHAELTLLHVRPSGRRVIDDAHLRVPGGANTADLAAWSPDAREFESLLRWCRDLGVSAQGRMSVGDPVARITEAARVFAADWIVLPRYSGSDTLAAEVALEADCDVVVVPLVREELTKSAGVTRGE